MPQFQDLPPEMHVEIMFNLLKVDPTTIIPLSQTNKYFLSLFKKHESGLLTQFDAASHPSIIDALIYNILHPAPNTSIHLDKYVERYFPDRRIAYDLNFLSPQARGKEINRLRCALQADYYISQIIRILSHHQFNVFSYYFTSRDFQPLSKIKKLCYTGLLYRVQKPHYHYQKRYPSFQHREGYALEEWTGYTTADQIELETWELSICEQFKNAWKLRNNEIQVGAGEFYSLLDRFKSIAGPRGIWEVCELQLNWPGESGFVSSSGLKWFKWEEGEIGWLKRAVWGAWGAVPGVRDAFVR